MHTKQIGTLGEVAIAKDLISKGYLVFTEIGDLSKIDLIALKDNKLVRIQVKSYAEKNGIVNLYTTKSGPNYHFRYEEDTVDVFAVYVYNRNLIFYVSSKELLKKRRSLAIRIDEGTSGQKIKANMSQNYIDFEKSLAYSSSHNEPSQMS